MTGSALFVDLANFYSCLLRSGIDEPRLLRDYFLHWLDFDSLAAELTGDSPPIWVFYSGNRLGPSENRIVGKYLEDYITRINCLRGVTARDVNIPGTQREPVTFDCENCGHKGAAIWESEKGIDTALTVHLFDTTDAWDIAYLLSCDADYVPAVASLRRRGKIVIGAGFSGAAAALVRECYDYVDLGEMFVKNDVVAYRMFGEKGIAERWLTDDVHPQAKGIGDVTLSVEYSPYEDQTIYFLRAEGPIDLSNRIQSVEDLRKTSPSCVVDTDLSHDRKVCSLMVSPSSGTEKRRIEGFFKGLQRVEEYPTRGSGTGCRMHYRYNSDSGVYEVMS